jgi:hypothetical protein
MNKKVKVNEEIIELKEDSMASLENLQPDEFMETLPKDFIDVIPEDMENHPKLDVFEKLTSEIKEIKKNRWVEVECMITNDQAFNFADYWFDSNEVIGVSSINDIDFVNAGISDLSEYDIDPENCCQIFFRNKEKPLIVMDFTPAEMLEKLS